MENMARPRDRLTVPNWVLINQPKIPQMPQDLSAWIVCPSPKVLNFYEKKVALGVRSPCLEVWNETNSRSELFTVKLFVVACICTYVSSCIRVETDETRYVNAQYFLINDQPRINIFPVIFFTSMQSDYQHKSSLLLLPIWI